MSAWRKYVAELIGTAVLVFMGCGSAVIAGEKVGFLGISLAFGLSVLVMVYTIGPISGCHINPAITVAALLTKRIKAKDAIAYIVSQFLGGILGAYVLLEVVERRAGYSLAANGLGQNGYGVHSPMGYSLVGCAAAEIILTALFLLVIFGATSKNAPQGFAGLAIGLSLTLIHIVGIPITGTSVNPARSLGPALVVCGDALSQVWLFLLAPVVGGIVAAVIWKRVLGQE